MTERDKIVRDRWGELKERLLQYEHVLSFRRLIPIFTEAQKHPLLGKLYPYTSHECLSFSFETTYPWSPEYPSVGPIPSVTEAGFLKTAQETSEDAAISIIQRFLSRYQFLFKRPHPPFQFDDNHQIIRVDNLEETVDWIMEHTEEMYVVYRQCTTSPEADEILGIVNTYRALELLVETITSTDERTKHFK